MNHEINEIVKELTDGKGFHIIRGAVDPETISYALKFVRRATNTLSDNITERRLWDLHKKNERLSSIANYDIAKQVFNKILGKKHKISSFGANRLMPGAPAQEPHTDYPYWGLFNLESLPMNINSTFALACQMLVPLTDFTMDNGGTEIVPHTQKLCRYPDQAEFTKAVVKVDLNAGDMMLYHSLLWHRAGFNNSQEDRITILGQYTAYFVKDMV